MNYTEIIQSQVSLLADLNQALAGQATPESAREIRKNVRLIAQLIEVKKDDVVADLEERLEALEGLLLGVSDIEQAERYYTAEGEPDPDPVIFEVRNLYDWTNGVCDWIRALEKHLGLEEGWDEEAGESPRLFPMSRPRPGLFRPK